MTAEPESTFQSPQPLVSAPDKTVLFMARRSELRLTKQARYPLRNPVTGASEGVSNGQFVAFREGVFRCPKEGTVVLQDSADGGIAEVDAQEVLDWLRKHRRFSDPNEGFWEVPATAPPVTGDELDRIVQAATEFDRDTLVAIVEQETAGWQREDILRVAKGSIDRIDAMVAKAEEQAQAQTSEAAQALEEERKQREAIEKQLKAAQDEAKKLKAAAEKGAK